MSDSQIYGKIFTEVAENSPDRIMVTDREGRIVYVNPAFARITGFTWDEAVGQTPRLLKSGHQDRAFYEELWNSIRAGGSFRCEILNRKKNGELYWEDQVILPITDDRGKIAYFVSHGRDISEQKRIEQRESETGARYAQLVEQSPYGIWIVRGFRIDFANRACARILGAGTADELIGRDVRDFIHPDHLAPVTERLERVAQGDDAPLAEVAFVRADGSKVEAEVAARRVVIDGEPAIQVVGCDITVRKRIDRHRSHLVQILESTGSFVSFAGPDLKLRYINAAGRRMLGLNSPKDVAQVQIPDIHPEWASDLIQNEGIPVALERGTWTGESALLTTAGEELPVSQVIVAHRGENDELEFISTIAHDISQQKRDQRHLQYLADHNQMTGLFNRSRFQSEVDRRLVSARAQSRHGALFFIDIDHFRIVNATLGYEGGNRLLREIATELRRLVSADGVLGHFGSDEFVAMVFADDLVAVESLARTILDRFAVRERRIGGHPVSITASIGVALFPGDGLTAAELIGRADEALYQAKNVGRNGFRRYRPEDEWDALVHSKMAWEVRIKDALENDRFALYSQPIVGLDGGETACHELLLRMMGENGDVISPAEFIPVAERFGLIKEIDRWVLLQAIRFLADAQGPPLMVTVNLSRQTLNDLGLLSMMKQAFYRYNVDPGHLVIEMTETAVLHDIDRMEALLLELKELGCRIALDDFGKGFSSFGSLRRLPVDILKIDGEYIQGLENDPVNQHLVRSMAELSRALGKQTVAEYVETRETLHLIRQFGITYAQGYYLGRPAPISVLDAAAL